MEVPQSQRAQASAELVAIVPILVAATLLLAQAVLAGWTLLSAGEAARAGARAALVGENVKTAAEGAIPALLGSAEVTESDAEVKVEIRSPVVVPGMPAIPLASAASLDPEAG